MKTKSLIVTKLLDEKNHDSNVVSFVASTSNEDRYGDIINQDGWSLESYRKNPIVLLNHDSTQLPLGKGEVEVIDGQLLIEVEFDMEDPKGKEVARKVKQGFINAVSVGFNSSEQVQRNELPKESKYYSEKGIYFNSAELLEVSIVTIPANPHAIAAKNYQIESLLKNLLLITREKTDYGLKSNASEAMKALKESTQKALKNKAKLHNEEHGDNPAKKITNSNYLAVSYHRGLSAYHNNPSSVRPSVTSDAQWAMARVNGLLYALRNGKYKSGKFDVDLLPKDHPMSKKEKMKEEEQEKAIITLEEDQILMIKEIIEQLKGSVKSHSEQVTKLSSLIDMKISEDKMKEEEEDDDDDKYYDEDEDSEEEKENKYFIKLTNFPKKGEDKKISMRNSNYKSFPLSYAEKIKSDYPSIWKKGGNIKGNSQFAILSKIQNENNGVPKTKSQEDAIKLREAWAARHKQDFLLAGVVAQMKWLVIGSRGLNHMKEVIEKEKLKLDQKNYNEALIAAILSTKDKD
jgi:HK97 family phage prohead protease